MIVAGKSLLCRCFDVIITLPLGCMYLCEPFWRRSTAFESENNTCLAFIHTMTSSNGNIFRVTGHLCGEFTGPGEFPSQRPVTRSFDVSFDLRLNKRLRKQSWDWSFETLLRPLWRQCNDKMCTSSRPPASDMDSCPILEIRVIYIGGMNNENFV